MQRLASSIIVEFAVLISSDESANRTAGVIFKALHSFNKVVSVGVLLSVSIYIIIFCEHLSDRKAPVAKAVHFPWLPSAFAELAFSDLLTYS